VKNTKVLLIGGPPGAGKTTLGKTLAFKLGVTSLTIDDLMVAARAVTTPESHPGLHVMSTGDSIDYFTQGPIDKLIQDARMQHEATWPAVEKVIKNHASSWGSRIVVDGWSMRPKWVVELGLKNVKSGWIFIDPDVLKALEQKNTDLFGKSSDPKRMLENFMARSLWHNDLIRNEAVSLGLQVLKQDGNITVDEMCEEVLGGID
jgi:2-phosphoglycerate kinase